jgi:hypothetical protein
MSFLFDFVAKDRAAAKAAVAQRAETGNCPAAVAAFITTALDNLPPLTEGEVDKAYHVKANGHLQFERQLDYGLSNAVIVVQPISFEG